MDASGEVIPSPARAQWIAVVAVFGAVWGATEITLGALMRSAAIPLHGVVPAGAGVIIMLVARQTLLSSGRRGRGSALAIGLVAAAMLPFSVSRGVAPAMVGILAESACLELVLLAGRPTRWRFALAGMCATLIPPVQMVLWLAVQYGPAAMSTFREILIAKQGGEKLGLAGQTAGALLALALVVSAVFGLFCGTLAWSLGRQILRRLGRAPA
jgi:hypothetical protein